MVRVDGERPLCGCHQEPMGWQKDGRLKAGGWWECRIRRAEANATRTTNPERHRRVRQQQRDQWHAAGGGYVRRRRKDLAKQRQQVLDQLSQLNEEGAKCRSAVIPATRKS